MSNTKLDSAVEALFVNGRLLRRFRRDPDAALRRFDLSDEEVRAVKAGDEHELLRLGLDPALVWPQTGSTAAIQSWAVRNAKRLAPAAFMAAAFLAWPAAGQAVPRTGGPPGRRIAPGRRRARRRIARARARQVARRGDVAPGLIGAGPGPIEQ